MIKHEDSKWVLYTKDGSKKLGTHDTEAEAEAQERAIEASKERNAEVRHLHLLGAVGAVRFEKLNDREHIVVPVVALMEGVIHAVNADSPEFVPLPTLQKAAESWNGKPVVLNHPVRNGKQCSANSPEIIESYGIGTIFNSRVEGTKLLQEAWIDREKATKRHPKMVDKLLQGQLIEVSVGAFAGTDTSEGEHNGRRYKGVWLQTQGDHLAFLPDGRGACSIEMGCGAHRAATMRVCEDHFEEVELKDASLLPEKSNVETEEEQKKKDEEYMRAAIGARNNKSDLGRIQAMHDKSVELGAMCAGAELPSQEKILEEVKKHIPEEFRASEESLQWAIKFLYGKSVAKKKDCPTCKGTGSYNGNPCESCDGTGKIRAAEAVPQPSQEEIDQILVQKAAAGEAAFRAACRCGEKDMTPEQKAEIIKTIIGDKHSGFTTGDEKMLEAASDERLESFRVAADARRKHEDELKAAATRQFTTEEFMAAAPPELKSLFERQQKQETEMKTALITEIKALQSEFSETELSVMNVTELMRMARALKVDPVKIDYSGRGIPRALATNDGPDYSPPKPYDAPLKALRGASA